ncbi:MULTISPECIES: putative immunity protein [unclassified Streptomyces]|uniref:putative immunity protein n=1 Tax=unclassified Streptomyces TaxID=2593676 RepID=UPI00278C5873|nr:MULTISPECIES: exonuclease SbcC [unclassified Streptomyces]
MPTTPRTTPTHSTVSRTTVTDTTVTGDFDLTMDELRAVARYAAQSAEQALPVFEAAVPDDPRTRAAVDAAWDFVGGAKRSRLQRVTALDAHRAAKEADTEAVRRATPAVVEVLSRYPAAPHGKSRVAHLMRALDAALRGGAADTGHASAGPERFPA